MARVLVLGEDTRAFLAVVRSLGRADIEVHVAWCPWNSAALQSRYVRHVHSIAQYRSDARAWLDDFNRLCREHQFELVLPCTDGTILPLQLHRDELEHADRVCLLPDDVYRTLSSKEETYILARRLGVPLPAQVTASTLEQVRAAADEFGFPLVLKPKSSASKLAPLVRRKVEKVYRAEDLDAIAGPMLHGDILAQQNFTGIGVGVEVLCKDGDVLTAFQHERIHEPLMGGGSSYRKSVPLHEGMLDATDRLMKALRYTGVAMAEFKYNLQTRSWVLIEINARFWGALPLSMAAGLDFPRYLYEMLCHGRSDFPRQYRTNVYSRHWSSDLQWMRVNLTADHRNPDVMSLPWGRVAAELVHIALLRERSDTFVWDDPRPAIADLREYFGHKLFAVTKGLGVLRGPRYRETLRAVRVAKKIIFACHGNICRSPFASAVLDAMRIEGITCFSAGCFPAESRRSPDAAIEAAARFGIDLSEHGSHVLTPGDVEAADLILVFDRRNVDEIEGLFAGVRTKLGYLGALDQARSLEIADPYGSGVEEFLKCYERIQRIIREVWAGSPCAAERDSGMKPNRILG